MLIAYTIGMITNKLKTLPVSMALLINHQPRLSTYPWSSLNSDNRESSQPLPTRPLDTVPEQVPKIVHARGGEKESGRTKGAGEAKTIKKR